MAGHDVVDIAEIASGITDVSVLAIAHDQDRILPTEDKDFGELVFRMRLEARLNERLLGRYTVIEKTRSRSRSLRPPT
jgi:predicted nuclease of predicted toxin-antitoxin system